MSNDDMRVASISVIANARGQALLLREGGWGNTPFTKMTASPTPHGIDIKIGAKTAGIAQTSALSALAASNEFFIGDIADKKAVPLRSVSLVLNIPDRTP